MTVFDVERNTKSGQGWKWNTCNVYIVAVNFHEKTVLASWNGNSARLFSERTWSKWRLKKPK